MRIYTVHEPRRLSGDPTADAERFAFVRDGFHAWAFLLGPLWMLWHRMWLVLVGYVVVAVAIQVGLNVTGVASPAGFVVTFLLALLIGFEAATLRRWTLRKRRQVGVVVGRDLEDAERRFFDSWIVREAMPTRPAAPAAAAAYAVPPHDVIGLFPEPAARP